MRVFTGNPVCATLALVSVLIVPQLVQAEPAQIASTDSATPDIAKTETVKAETVPCEQRDVVLDESKDGVTARASCVSPSHQTTEARIYLIQTARPGSTMARQGADVAIGRLHPDFVVRLADAIREAREEGLAEAGIFSAYRPPAFGVGGFSDKFNSLHAYGLAVDMHGIGKPGSDDAEEWHRIAAKHGVVCPYGSRDRAEWNHCQPTRVKIVREDSHLRETITANGPRDLQSMFDAGTALINNVEEVAETVVASVGDLLGLKFDGKTVVGEDWCDNSNAMKAHATASRADMREARRAIYAERRQARAERYAAQRAARANARMAVHAAAVLARGHGKNVHISRSGKTRNAHVRMAHAAAKKSYRRSQARLRRSNNDG